jgi:hypothetical protein
MRTSAYRWETQDVLIPLAFSVMRWPKPDYVGAATPRAQSMIAARLAQQRTSLCGTLLAQVIASLLSRMAASLA